MRASADSFTLAVLRDEACMTILRSCQRHQEGGENTAADTRSDLSDVTFWREVHYYYFIRAAIKAFKAPILITVCSFSLFSCFYLYLRCHVDLEHIHASAALGRGTMNRRSPELWYVLPPFLPSPALSVLCSLFFSFLHLCCWIGSVLGSTCPQNEYTFACIRTLPWLCLPPAAPSSLINDPSAPLLARPLSRSISERRGWLGLCFPARRKQHQHALPCVRADAWAYGNPESCSIIAQRCAVRSVWINRCCSLCSDVPFVTGLIKIVALIKK